MDQKPLSLCSLCPLMPLLEQCVPEAAREHFRSALIEFFKGVGSLFDPGTATSSKGAAKGKRVSVE